MPIVDDRGSTQGVKGGALISEIAGEAAPAPRAPLFTVFTPTWNRAHLIHRAYESLCAQTVRDFEWIVVDNASTDDTEAVVTQWQRTAKFPIRYIRQMHNQGIGTSYRVAVREAQGELFVTARDADTFVPHALECFAKHWQQIPPDERVGYVGVTAHCVDPQGRLIGDPFPGAVVDATFAEMAFRYRVRGEKWGFQRTDVMRKYVTPVAEGYVGYMPESVMWRRIGARYRTRYVNEPLRTYYIDPNGQSWASKPWTKAFGLMFDAREALNNDLRWFVRAPLPFVKAAIQYARLSYHLRRPAVRQLRGLRGLGARLLWALMLAPARVLYELDERRRRALGEEQAFDPGDFRRWEIDAVAPDARATDESGARIRA